MWQVIGQARVVSSFQRSLERGSLSHAYLFVGPAHIGKMTLALNLAQALNCERTEAPCGECASCQQILSDRHPDVQVISLSRDAEPEARARAEISIDQVRQLQHSASLPSFAGRYKIFIIDGAESLSTEAANCLLKTLEEPVGKVVFILLTINERLLPETVVSRCQRVELLPLATIEIETALNSRWGVEPERAKLLARLVHGGLGWAVLAAGNDGLLKQHTEHRDELLEIVSADIEKRFVYADRLANQFSQNRALVQERLDLWLDWWRDMLLIKAGLSEAVTNIDRSGRLMEMAKDYSLFQIRAFIGGIRTAGEQLKQNASPRLVLEALMLGLPEVKRVSTSR